MRIVLGRAVMRKSEVKVTLIFHSVSRTSIRGFARLGKVFKISGTGEGIPLAPTKHIKDLTAR